MLKAWRKEHYTHKNGSIIRVNASAKKRLAKHHTEVKPKQDKGGATWEVSDETQDSNVVTGVNGSIVQQLSHGPNIWKVNSKKGKSGTHRDLGGLTVMLSGNWVGHKSYRRWKVIMKRAGTWIWEKEGSYEIGLMLGRKLAPNCCFCDFPILFFFHLDILLDFIFD